MIAIQDEIIFAVCAVCHWFGVGFLASRRGIQIILNLSLAWDRT
jgi:hypothetical protein